MVNRTTHAVALTLCLLLAAAACRRGERPRSETVTFPGGKRELRGLVYKPDGPGPFPAVLYNHGSAPGLVNNEAFDAIAPVFVARAGRSLRLTGVDRRIYPAFGTSDRDGHSLPYRGVNVWRDDVTAFLDRYCLK